MHKHACTQRPLFGYLLDVHCRRSAHRRVAVAVRSSASWIRSAEVDRERLGGGQPGSLLAEDLIHHLGAPSKGRHDLISVDQLCRGGLIVPGEQRDRFDRHAMRGQ